MQEIKLSGKKMLTQASSLINFRASDSNTSNWAFCSLKLMLQVIDGDYHNSDLWQIGFTKVWRLQHRIQAQVMRKYEMFQWTMIISMVIHWWWYWCMWSWHWYDIYDIDAFILMVQLMASEKTCLWGRRRARDCRSQSLISGHRGRLLLRCPAAENTCRCVLSTLCKQLCWAGWEMSIQSMGQSLTRLLLEYEVPQGVLKVEQLQASEGKMNGR